jgi:hypothetical protein
VVHALRSMETQFQSLVKYQLRLHFPTLIPPARHKPIDGP